MREIQKRKMRSFESQLRNLRQSSLYRELRTLDSPQGIDVAIDGKNLLNFSSNDYLALANCAELREAFHRAIDAHGVGAGASRLVSGSLAPHRELEETIADFKRCAAALTFSSGFAAALGIMGACLEKGDFVILDKLCHASLIDAARLSGAAIRIFPHNHLEKLESHLRWASGKAARESRVLVVTESVFSMDGDLAPLREIVDLKDRFGALLLVDEAHAVGVLGPQGRGLADELGLAARVDLQLGTLSKAAGISGGYVCGAAPAIQLLVNRARSFIYSTAPPPAVAATAAEAIRLIEGPEGERRRAKLRANIDAMREALGLDAPPLSSAIIPVILGSEERALRAGTALREKGFLVPAIRYPTVARDSARLRVTLSAAHSRDQIEGLASAIREVE